LFYNPLLRKDFDYVYKAEYEEYVRLYRREPTHFDGHHHMHLCTNMLVNKVIPRGSKVRRGFTFLSSERNVLNRNYRRIVDVILEQRYTCTDVFFSVTPPQNTERLRRIINLAKSKNVELMVHPERIEDFNCLMSDEFVQMIAEIKSDSYAFL